MVWTQILVGFFLLLRKGNICPDSWTKFDPNYQLLCQDVSKASHTILMNIKWTKMRKTISTLKLPLLKLVRDEICSINAINCMLERFPGNQHDPLFFYLDNGVKTPTSYNQIKRLLRKWLAAIGENPKAYTLHCLRREGANWALDIDLPSEAIRLMGLWASDAFNVYLDSNIVSRANNMVQFVDAIDNILDEFWMFRYRLAGERDGCGPRKVYSFVRFCTPQLELHGNRIGIESPRRERLYPWRLYTYDNGRCYTNKHQVRHYYVRSWYCF